MAFGDLKNSITVRGFRFKLDINDDNSAEYECRGETYIDDEGDEQVEPALEEAAYALKRNMISAGYEAEICWSEKGWIGVGISNINI